jgi:hypothetical protein
MDNNFPDIIILTGVPKSEGLHGLEPTPLPKARIALKEKMDNISIESNPLLKLGILAISFYLLIKIFK